jgi:hypothetical protein
MIQSLREVPVNFHAPESNHRRCRVRSNFASATRVLNALASRHVRRCLLSHGESKHIVLRTRRSTFFAFRGGPSVSRIRVRPNFRSTSAPILERRAGCDLKVIVAGLAPDIVLPVIAAAFADRLARCVKHWEIITDNLKKAGWHCGCIAQCKN